MAQNVKKVAYRNYLNHLFEMMNAWVVNIQSNYTALTIQVLQDFGASRVYQYIIGILAFQLSNERNSKISRVAEYQRVI